MITATDILSKYGIHLRAHRHGNQKVRCPKCSDTRRNRKEPCLSVDVGEEGVRFLCHNCGYHGGEFYDQRREDYGPRKPQRRAPDERSVRKMYQ